MEKVKITVKTGWPLAGNRQITDFLAKSAANGKIANTYIFLGPEDLGKTAAAVFFAESLLCQKQKAGEFSLPCGACSSCRQMHNRGGNLDSSFETLHGDFHLLKREKDKKNISVEQVREFIRILEMSSFMNSYKIGIIKDADSLSEGAANALLKTLEEPQEKVVVILTATRLEKIPKTIISRSQVMRFFPVKSSVIYDYLVDDLNCPRTFAKDLARLAAGRPALAAKFFADKEFYQSYLAKTENFLDFFSGNINDRFAGIEKIIGRETDEEKAEKIINILNIWQGVVRDFILLSSNNGDLIQHEPLREKLEKIAGSLGGGRLFKINASLKMGEKYVGANVSPKLVLEDIAVNI
jgi:DNA polymerase III subunit delta'